MQGNPNSDALPQQMLAAGTYTSTQTPSTGIDTRGFTELIVVINAGTFTSTAAMTVTIEESSASDGSGDAFAVIGTFPVINSSNHQKVLRGRIRLQGKNRYVRAVSTYAGSGNSPMSIEGTLLHPRDSSLVTGTAYDLEVA